jgi:hypothetical protein
MGRSGSGPGHGSDSLRDGRIRWDKGEGLLFVHSVAAEIHSIERCPGRSARLGGCAHRRKAKRQDKQFGWSSV